MKKNEKSVSILTGDGAQGKASRLPDEKRGTMERIKKPLVFALMGIVCAGSLYLIFKPSADKKQTLDIGLNDSVPQPSQAILQEDKQKAYEQEMLQEKEDQKRSTLTTLSDYWNEHNSADAQSGQLNEQDPGSTAAGTGNPALNSYRNAQSELGSFYREDNSEAKQLRKELEQLKDKLAQKEVPAAVTVDDQLALMEKSYQMAAKYLPSGTSTTDTGKSTPAPAAPAVPLANPPFFTAFTPEVKSGVSSLYRAPADSAFSGSPSQRGFYTAGSQLKAVQPKNSVKACVHQAQTIIGEGAIQLRLLEPARIPGRTIASGAILSASAKIQSGRLQLKVTSLELAGSIIPVDISIYDIDGQQGLEIPYSAEISALTEMAGNMSQQSGTSLMMTQSAGQQIAADLSRGVVQGISGYFSKKVRAQKVTLNAGHQVFLVSKK